MGAPRRWIKQFLGLKKSDKIVSLDEEEKSPKIIGKIHKGVSEKQLNQNVDAEYEDADWHWDLDQSSASSTSLQAKNAAQLPLDEREEGYDKDENSEPDDMPASPPVQQDWKEEWVGGIYAKESNFQSAVDSPTSPEVESSDQLEQDSGEGWATPDVREVFDSDPDPSTSSQGQYTVLLKDNESEELASRCTQTDVRGFLVQNGVKAQLPMSEESAAIRIQTVYRGFVAKRAYRALKGLTRLRDQLESRTLKRQTAIALRCIQALVKVQARSRAKHVLTAIEGQAVQQKLFQQLEHEAPVKNKKPEVFTYDGWCDKVGSAREVQARMLKRKEAAAKREKAKAYSLARQWQAGIRQPPPQPQKPLPQPPQQQPQLTTTAVFPSEKCEWGWNWLDRWMTVRPWEAQVLVDASLRDGMKSPNSERVASMDVPTSPLPSTERKLPASSIGNGKLNAHLSNTIKLPNDGSSPSPRNMANVQETSTTSLLTKSPRPSRPTIGPRSFSTPRERSNLSDTQDKKRLSLPGTMHGARLLAQNAIKSPRNQNPRMQSPRVLSPHTPQKPGNPRTKLNGNEIKASKLSR